MDNYRLNKIDKQEQILEHYTKIKSHFCNNCFMTCSENQKEECGRWFVEQAEISVEFGVENSIEDIIK